MARPKDRPILFEVVSKAGGLRPASAERPPGFRLSSLARRIRLKPDRPGKPRDSSTREQPAAPMPGTAPALSSAPQRAARFEWLSVLPGRRFNVVASWAGVAALAAFVLFLLFLAFQAGRRWVSGPEQPTTDADPIKTVLESEPNPAVLEIPESQRRNAGRIATPPKPEHLPPAADAGASGEEIRRTASPHPSESARDFVLEKGRYYVVIQHFQKNKRADADAAAGYLRSNGVPCELLSFGGDIQLFPAQSFALDPHGSAESKVEQQRADELMRRIRELGKQYFKTGRYDFRYCALHKQG